MTSSNSFIFNYWFKIKFDFYDFVFYDRKEQLSSGFYIRKICTCTFPQFFHDKFHNESKHDLSDKNVFHRKDIHTRAFRDADSNGSKYLTFSPEERPRGKNNIWQHCCRVGWGDDVMLLGLRKIFRNFHGRIEILYYRYHYFGVHELSSHVSQISSKIKKKMGLLKFRFIFCNSSRM